MSSGVFVISLMFVFETIFGMMEKRCFTRAEVIPSGPGLEAFLSFLIAWCTSCLDMVRGCVGRLCESGSCGVGQTSSRKACGSSAEDPGFPSLLSVRRFLNCSVKKSSISLGSWM